MKKMTMLRSRVSKATAKKNRYEFGVLQGRVRTTMIASTKQELLVAYRRGAKYLRKREQAAGLGKRQPKVLHDLPGGKRCQFGKDFAGKQIARLLAAQLGVDEKTMQADAKFAESVETIVKNCGPAAKQAIFAAKRPAKRKAIMELSRTSAERQRYRVEGFLAGCFKSIKIQGDDPVFDTVEFKEVPSRLCRARGSLNVCCILLNGPIPPGSAITAECLVLVKRCRRAANLLGRFLSTQTSTKLIVPASLCRERVQPILDCRDVRGQEVGRARAALKLTIKSVWDYPEMQRRRMSAKPSELARTRKELATIIGTAKAILTSNT